MTPPVATALYAGLCALIQIWLTFRVVRIRRARRIAYGDAGDADLLRAVRAHGNAAETMPLALILIGLTELLGAPVWVVHGLGVLLVAGRLAHAHSCRAGASLRWRELGVAATLAVYLMGGVGLIGHALQA